MIKINEPASRFSSLWVDPRGCKLGRDRERGHRRVAVPLERERHAGERQDGDGNAVVAHRIPHRFVEYFTRALYTKHDIILIAHTIRK